MAITYCRHSNVKLQQKVGWMELNLRKEISTTHSQHHDHDDIANKKDFYCWFVCVFSTCGNETQELKPELFPVVVCFFKSFRLFWCVTGSQFYGGLCVFSLSHNGYETHVDSCNNLRLYVAQPHK